MTKAKAKLNLEWEVPQKGKKPSEIDPDIIKVSRTIPTEHTDFKYKNHYLKLNRFGVEKYLDLKQEKGKNRCKMAFSFTDDHLIVTFKPKAGVPSYDIAKSSPDRSVNHKDIIEKIYDYFQIDRVKTRQFRLKIEYFDNIDGMELYTLNPIDLAD